MQTTDAVVIISRMAMANGLEVYSSQQRHCSKAYIENSFTRTKKDDIALIEKIVKDVEKANDQTLDILLEHYDECLKIWLPAGFNV